MSRMRNSLARASRHAGGLLVAVAAVAIAAVLYRVFDNATGMPMPVPGAIVLFGISFGACVWTRSPVVAVLGALLFPAYLGYVALSGGADLGSPGFLRLQLSPLLAGAITVALGGLGGSLYLRRTTPAPS